MTTSTAMRLLPLERSAMIERRPCPRCETSGAHAGGACMTCGQYGYLPTLKGRELLTKVALLIGGRAPIDGKGRFAEYFLRTVLGRELRTGMKVRRAWSKLEEEYRVVLAVEYKNEQAIVVRYDHGYPTSTTDLASFDRILTDDELDRADAWIAQHVGNGAVRAEA